MKTAVAVSGGVDSMVAVHLLKATHNIFALHFVTGYESKNHSHYIQKLAAYLDNLNVPLISVDISDAFQSQVVNYFISTYSQGRTPNPCVICNARIKFGVLQAYAMKMGADSIATGHYAQIDKTDTNIVMKKGLDTKKDQSYFLGLVSGKRLESAIFPLGQWTKDAVLTYAENNGITEIAHKESQEVCFIHDRYSDFLIRSGCIKKRPGPIVTTSGKQIGQHNGLHEFTIGQRKGINCPGPHPYYVVRLDQVNHRLVVGQKKDLLSDSCRVDNINWLGVPPKTSIVIHVRIRYKTPAVSATLKPISQKQARIFFHDLQSAVTPGQIAVFYQEDIVLGAGFIITNE